MAVTRAALIAVALLAGAGCGEQRANRASCLRGLDLCVRELAARGCATTTPAPMTTTPVPMTTTPVPMTTTPAVGGADAGVGMNEASCLVSHRTCRERLATCARPTTTTP